MWLDFDVRDNRRWTFSLEEVLLWIMDLYFVQKCQFDVKNFLMMDLFQLLSSQDVNGWLEWCGLLVDYCDVFISCLDSHSDGTHSLQSIHWNKLICILDGMKVSTFSAIFHFWMYYSFKSYLYTNSLYQHNFGNLVCFPQPVVSQRSRMIRDTPGHLLLGKKQLIIMSV